MRHKKYLFFFSLTLTIMACGTPQPYNSGLNDVSHISDVEFLDPSIPLSDHLRRLPGVSVQGTGINARVTMPGMKSLSSDPEPLFVIDGQMLCGGFRSAVSSVDINDIASIRVLRNVNSTSDYGFRGANAVIEIITKK